MILEFLVSGACGAACGFYAGVRSLKPKKHKKHPQQLTPADLDAAARAFWIEAEKAHAAKYAERNGS